MNTSIQAVLLAAALSLLLGCTAAAQVYHHGPTGIVFPERIATLEKEEEVTNFEPKQPGLGISIGYQGEGIAASVYLYTMGLKAIPADLQSPVLKEQFNQAVEDVLAAGKLGYYSEVRKTFDGEAAWGDAGEEARSLHAAFSFKRDGQERLSHLFLLSFKNHFLKVRFTYPKEQHQAGERIRRRFLRRLAACLQEPGADAQPVKRPAPRP